MRNKLFTKEQKEAIAIVLDMDLHIVNWYGETLKATSLDYEIDNRMMETKEYRALSSALTQFLKEH